MNVLKLLLVILGIGLFGSAGALVVYDVVVAAQLRPLVAAEAPDIHALKEVRTAGGRVQAAEQVHQS